MKIYDCFPFFNETDLLEIRLHELGDVVDKFILVESPFTHQGNPKPLYYACNKSRFEQFNDKIIHVIEDFHDTASDPWAREQAQRNRISKEIEQLDAQDIVMVSDLDEIPRAASIPQLCASLQKEPELIYLHMKFYYYYLNCEFKHIKWSRGVIAPVNLLRGQNLTRVRLSYTELPRVLMVLGKPELVSGSTLSAYGSYKDHIASIKDNFSGWHFSYAGGEDRIIEKLKAFAHAEFNTNKICNKDFIRSTIARRTGLVGNDTYDIVPIDETFPKFVRDNLETFTQKGFIKA